MKMIVPFGNKRVLGVYPQRQEGLFMQRIPLLGGRIEASQLRRIAGIAQQYTHGTPLHLTTRQDIELHNVPDAHIAAVQQELAAIDISTYGACGDCVRNITVCPCCAVDTTATDMMPLAEQVRDAMLAAALTLDLPRKFKISFTGCGGTGARPYLQDLGFVALSPEAIRVIGAGSLGPRPQTGIVLYESILPQEVLPLVFAALELFAEHGDRQNRRAARLRHIRQRMGDAVFKEMLDNLFRKHKQTRLSPIRLFNGQGGFEKCVTLQTIGGDLSILQANVLATLSVEQDIQLRINLWHGIDLYSRLPFDLPDILKPLTDLPRIIACPGNSTCPNGLTDCRAAAPIVAARLAQTGRSHLMVGISGCANNCALSAVCDLGLVGRKKTVDGVQQDAYDIYEGGGNGGDARLSERKKTLFASELAHL